MEGESGTLGTFLFSLPSISGLYAPALWNSISNEKITKNHSQPRHLDLKQTGRNLEGVRILPNISNIATSANLRGFAPFCKENRPYFENEWVRFTVATCFKVWRPGLVLIWQVWVSKRGLFFCKDSERLHTHQAQTETAFLWRLPLWVLSGIWCPLWNHSNELKTNVFHYTSKSVSPSVCSGVQLCAPCPDLYIITKQIFLEGRKNWRWRNVITGGVRKARGDAGLFKVR